MNSLCRSAIVSSILSRRSWFAPHTRDGGGSKRPCPFDVASRSGVIELHVTSDFSKNGIKLGGAFEVTYCSQPGVVCASSHMVLLAADCSADRIVSFRLCCNPFEQLTLSLCSPSFFGPYHVPFAHFAFFAVRYESSCGALEIGGGDLWRIAPVYELSMFFV